jgi:hypothetical protein
MILNMGASKLLRALLLLLLASVTTQTCICNEHGGVTTDDCEGKTRPGCTESYCAGVCRGPPGALPLVCHCEPMGDQCEVGVDNFRCAGTGGFNCDCQGSVVLHPCECVPNNVSNEGYGSEALEVGDVEDVLHELFIKQAQMDWVAEAAAERPCTFARRLSKPLLAALFSRIVCLKEELEEETGAVAVPGEGLQSDMCSDACSLAYTTCTMMGCIFEPSACGFCTPTRDVCTLVCGMMLVAELSKTGAGPGDIEEILHSTVEKMASMSVEAEAATAKVCVIAKHIKK